MGVHTTYTWVPLVNTVVTAKKILKKIQQLKMPVNDQCWHNHASWAKHNAHHASTSPPQSHLGKARCY